MGDWRTERISRPKFISVQLSSCPYFLFVEQREDYSLLQTSVLSFVIRPFRLCYFPKVLE